MLFLEFYFKGKIVWERILELCKENNTTKTALCKEITNSSSNLITWEKGNIRPDYLVEISKKFAVSSDYLLGLSDKKLLSNSSLSSKERRLILNFKELNQEGQEKLIEQAEDMSNFKISSKENYKLELGKEIS